MEIFIIQERHKRRHKFGGINVFQTEEIRKCFLNPKSEIEVFS